MEVAANFPAECRHLLETLGQVYGYDAEVRECRLTPDERLRLHQDRSGPVMDQLHGWLEAQLAERKTEPNSGLGKAITYLLRHWKGLTAFLREAGRRGWRCLRVVHGKGHGSPGRVPVLKAKVQRWLGQSDGVLAFTQASAPQGGAGALIVLLRG